MVDKKEIDLSIYRYRDAMETFEAASLCFENNHFKDAINRSYYAAFYAVKAVLALEAIDFKRHKDAVAYFNHNYVAGGIFQREIGKQLGRLKRKREVSDYDAFYVASREEAQEQLYAAQAILESVKMYLEQKDVLKDL